MKSRALDAKFTRQAQCVAEQSNCIRTKVGVIIVSKGKILVQASNGTPSGMRACADGGCQRCNSDTPRGNEYDSCLCIHAEQAAVALAARQGLKTNGATVYCTLRPCLTCAKLTAEAGIIRIVYIDEIQFSPSVEEAYKQFELGKKIKIERITEIN